MKMSQTRRFLFCFKKSDCDLIAKLLSLVICVKKFYLPIL